MCKDLSKMARPKIIYSFTSPTPARVSIHSVPFYIGFVIILILSCLYGIVYFVDGILPAPFMVKDEVNYPDAFISERASWDLKNLTNIGPRVVGSYENEFVTVDFLTERLNLILHEAHPNQHLEQDLQVVTGTYYLSIQNGILNSYDRVQNIIVKLHGKNASTSVLINSHFDSVPTSPGASDDGINVAAMLEILRILSRSENRPLHNVIFLFNGAEETPLQASHGFITQHKWAKECRVVVNLDAAGSGGKIILFQTGPQTSWLVKYYSGVPHPYGQVAGEELFQMDIIPSDTDFRIFRDFGNLVGLDMAFIKNGYRYHTKYDRYSYIPLGSYQHVGDNALFLVKSLANAPELYEPVPTEGKAVYYDFLGFFLIYYTHFVGVVVNLVTVVLSLVIFLYSMFSFKLGFSKSTLKFLAVSFGAILGSWLICIIFIFVVAVIIDLLGKTMSWYGRPWLVYGLYVIPTIELSGCLLFFTNHENIALNVRCQIQTHLVRLIWTIVLAIGVSFSVRACYALLIPVLFSSLAFLVIHISRLQHSVKNWKIVYASFLIIPSINLMYQSLITFSMFLPLTGRIGSDKNPELIIGFMTCFFTIIITSPLTVMTNSLRNARYYFIILTVVFGAFIAMIFTPLGFPYNGRDDNPTPQRQWLMHTSRKFFNETGNAIKEDAGFFFLNMDRNSPQALKKTVKNLSRAVSLNDDCINYAGCGLPLSHHKMMKIVEYSTWIPADEPVLPEPLDFKAVPVNVSKNELKYSISIKGPDRLTVYMVPREDVTLLNISLVNEVYPSRTTFNGRPMYFIYYQLGKGDMKFDFSFNVRVPDNWDAPTMNFTVVARYVHENKMRKTPQFVELLEQMPDWTDVTAWLGTNYVYVI